MRDMREKFGAEVKTFPYAFVIAKHYPGWDAPASERAPAQPDPIRLPTLPALGSGKAPKYIEIKSRS